MEENNIHKCLISYGFFPFTIILKELEEQDRFEECGIILRAMTSYRKKFKLVEDDIPTKWSDSFENEYYSYFKKIDENGILLAKSNILYYLKDIKQRLKL